MDCPRGAQCLGEGRDSYSVERRVRELRHTAISVSRRAGRKSHTPQPLPETALALRLASHFLLEAQSKQQHSQSREYPEDQFGCIVHSGSFPPSLATSITISFEACSAFTHVMACTRGVA